MTTPSEAVRVAVQECKRLAEDFAYENAMGAVYKTSAGRTDKRRAKLHAAIDALAALSLHVAPPDTTDAVIDILCRMNEAPGTHIRESWKHEIRRAIVGLRTGQLPSLSLHVGDASDVQSDALGATPAGSGSRGCAPIPGAEPVAWAIYDSQGYYTTLDTEDQARHFCATYNRRKTDDPLKPYTYRPLYTSPPPGAQDMTREVCSLALAVLGSVHPEGTDPYVIEAERRIRAIEARAARGIVSGEAGETPKVARPAGQEPGCEATRPEVHVTPGYVVTGGHFVESRAQPSPGERHALPRLQVPADEGLDTNERDGKRQETSRADLREVPTDQRPAAPPGAQEQAGVAQPSLHIEPETRNDD